MEVFEPEQSEVRLLIDGLIVPVDNGPIVGRVDDVVDNTADSTTNEW